MAKKINKTKIITVTTLGEKVDIEVKLKAKQLGIFIDHFNKVAAKAQTDEEVASALAGLTWLLDKGKEENASLAAHFMPQIIRLFYYELISLMQDLFGFTEEQTDDLELEDLINIVLTFITTVDMKAIADLVKKFQTPAK